MAEKHLIWDFDGTLYDTYPEMSEAMLLALADFHCSAPRAEAYALMKVTLYHCASVYAERFHLSQEELLAAFQRHHQQIGVFPPFCGMPDCIRDTHRLGCRHYLFTHRDHAAIDMLARDGLLPYFSDCVIRTDGFADKPSPEAILHLMRKHGFNAKDGFMIGDRDIDVYSGKNAGVGTLLLDPENVFPALEADVRVRSMEEITLWATQQCRSGDGLGKSV